jgi:hypothetical protein
MNKNLSRGLGMVLVLGALGLSLHAQRKSRTPPPPEEDGHCYCEASGADCLFGSAEGCYVFCPEGQLCDCRGASCPLGFPSSARCRCRLIPTA